jgi:hypothetical protein
MERAKAKWVPLAAMKLLEDVDKCLERVPAMPPYANFRRVAVAIRWKAFDHLEKGKDIEALKLLVTWSDRLRQTLQFIDYIERLREAGRYSLVSEILRIKAQESFQAAYDRAAMEVALLEPPPVPRQRRMPPNRTPKWLQQRGTQGNQPCEDQSFVEIAPAIPTAIPSPVSEKASPCVTPIPNPLPPESPQPNPLEVEFNEIAAEAVVLIEQVSGCKGLHEEMGRLLGEARKNYLRGKDGPQRDARTKLRSIVTRCESYLRLSQRAIPIQVSPEPVVAKTDGKKEAVKGEGPKSNGRPGSRHSRRQLREEFGFRKSR